MQKAVFDFAIHSEAEKSESPYQNGIVAQARRHIKHKDGGKIDTNSLWQWTKLEMLFISSSKDTHPAASFGHIIGGYSSRFYGYLWSLVYAEDLFAKFKADGIMNPETGMRYRKLILAPGSTKPAMELLKDFLGREPNDKAFLKSMDY